MNDRSFFCWSLKDWNRERARGQGAQIKGTHSFSLSLSVSPSLPFSLSLSPSHSLSLNRPRNGCGASGRVLRKQTTLSLRLSLWLSLRLPTSLRWAHGMGVVPVDTYCTNKRNSLSPFLPIFFSLSLSLSLTPFC